MSPLGFLSRRVTARSVDSTGSGDVKEKVDDTVLAHKDGIVTENEVVEGGLTFEQDTSGGMGRHLGVFSCTMIVVGRIIGTGIFSTPSSILSSVGSVGASMMLWVLGFLLSCAGLAIWLELGTMFPRSGGEKVYLEAMYKKPKYLVTVMFASYSVLLGFTASGCIVFASNILTAAQVPVNRWNERGIALGAMFFVTLIHGFTPRLGVYLMNTLSVIKLGILVFVVVAGWAVLGGHTKIEDPKLNFHDAFAGSSHSSNDYATAMFKIISSYSGWAGINYVMNDVKNPVRTLKIAGPLGLGIVAILYIFANISYFAASTKPQIMKSGVTVASLFFKNVFGTQAQRALTVFVALSALGNVVTVTFGAARIIQELAKEGVPLPFGNKFWASNWPTGKSPLPGLIVHLIPSVIVIIGPPPAIAYPFILDVEGYPGQIINFFIVIGLFWLRWRRPHLARPFKVWWPVAVFYLAAAVFLLVTPFLRPANKVGDTPPLPYYLYCLVGIAVLAFGVLYWAVWRVALPRMFGFTLEPRQEQLSDGTYYTTFDRKNVEKNAEVRDEKKEAL